MAASTSPEAFMLINKGEMSSQPSDPLSSTLEFLLLDVLAEQPRSYRQIATRMHGRIHTRLLLTNTSLDTVLTRLQQTACITASPDPEAIYSITPEGKRRLG